MTLAQLANELKGSIASLPYPLAKTLVQRARLDLERNRLWSFLRGETTLLVPPMIQTGTVAVTFGSPTVTADADAKAAWAAAGNPLLTTRQFRISFSAPIYNIWAYDADAGTLTLDRPYTEDTAAATTYSLYRCYFAAPVADFKRWETMKDMKNSQPITLNKTRQEVERNDPQRAASGDAPFWCVAYQTDNNPASPTYRWPLYELMPHPTAQKGITATYHRYGTGFASDTDTVPLPLSDELVLVRAKFLAYEWAEANKGQIAGLRGPNWLQLMVFAEKKYQTDLAEAGRNDEETFLTNVVLNESACGPVTLGADYLWNHDPR